MRWETDCHSDFSKRMVKGGQVRDLAQIENIKIVQRLRMGKSCELYEVEFLRDTTKRGGLSVLPLSPQGDFSEKLLCALWSWGCFSLLLNLPEKAQRSNWRLEDLGAEAKENSKGGYGGQSWLPKSLRKGWITTSHEADISSDRFIFLGSKITEDSDCSHKIKRCLPLGRKAMTNLDSILKSRGITLPTNVFSSSHVWM